MRPMLRNNLANGFGSLTRIAAKVRLFRQPVYLSVSSGIFFQHSTGEQAKKTEIDVHREPHKSRLRGKEIHLRIKEKLLFQSDLSVPKKYSRKLIEIVSNEVKRLTNIDEEDFHLFLAPYQNGRCAYIAVEKSRVPISSLLELSSLIYISVSKSEYRLVSKNQTEVSSLFTILLFAVLICSIGLFTATLIQGKTEAVLIDRIASQARLFKQFNETRGIAAKIQNTYVKDLSRIRNSNIPAKIHQVTSALPEGAIVNSLKVSGPTVELVGLTKNASLLVTSLQNNNNITEVEQISPITSDQRSGFDRFNLRLQLLGGPLR